MTTLSDKIDKIHDVAIKSEANLTNLNLELQEVKKSNNKQHEQFYAHINSPHKCVNEDVISKLQEANSQTKGAMKAVVFIMSVMTLLCTLAMLIIAYFAFKNDSQQGKQNRTASGAGHVTSP